MPPGVGRSAVRLVAESAGVLFGGAFPADSASGAVLCAARSAAAQLGGLADAAQPAAGTQQRSGGQPAHDPGTQQGGRPEQGALRSVLSSVEW